MRLSQSRRGTKPTDHEPAAPTHQSTTLHAYHQRTGPKASLTDLDGVLVEGDVHLVAQLLHLRSGQRLRAQVPVSRTKNAIITFLAARYRTTLSKKVPVHRNTEVYIYTWLCITWLLHNMFENSPSIPLVSPSCCHAPVSRRCGDQAIAGMTPSDRR